MKLKIPSILIITVDRLLLVNHQFRIVCVLRFGTEKIQSKCICF